MEEFRDACEEVEDVSIKRLVMLFKEIRPLDKYRCAALAMVNITPEEKRDAFFEACPEACKRIQLFHFFVYANLRLLKWVIKDRGNWMDNIIRVCLAHKGNYMREKIEYALDNKARWPEEWQSHANRDLRILFIVRLPLNALFFVPNCSHRLVREVSAFMLA